MTPLLLLLLHNFGGLLTYFLLILDTFRPVCNVGFLTKYCCSFYDAPLWLLSSHIVNKACTVWRKALRKMWRLSPMTHCDVITLISDCIPLEMSLQLRFYKFSSNILKYGSKVVKTVAKVALRNPFSTYCNNFLEITDRCVQFNINECHSFILKSRYYSITDEMSSNINILKDMIDIRDGMKECASLGVNDVNDIIDKICLN